MGAWTGGSLGRARTTRGRLASTYRVLELAVGHDPVRYRDLVADPQSKGNATRAARDRGRDTRPAWTAHQRRGLGEHPDLGTCVSPVS